MDPSEGVNALSELIIVCCHAVYVGQRGWSKESNWLLQPFQSSNIPQGKRGEHETFVAHILAGAIATISNPKAVLMFSGGRTTKHDRTEAAGYAEVLSELDLPQEGLKGRVLLEEHATDSYQNLLFSILRFHAVTGRYPSEVTVITHAFKERRFLNLHAPAIRWPCTSIRVQGINPPFTLAELDTTVKAEHKNGFALFSNDPYGVKPALDSKRRSRNWRDDTPASLTSNANVTKLLRWNGGADGRQIYPDALPWTED